MNPRLLLFTAALLLLSSDKVLSANHCPNCGTIPVPYPLSTSPNCGDPSYKIRCQNSTLVFDTINNTYPITSISRSTRTLIIKPANILPNTCATSDLLHNGFHLNRSLPFNITSNNTLMYLNCTPNILRSPLNCSEQSLCYTYINGVQSPCKNSRICCTITAGGDITSYSVRVWAAGCKAYTSFVNLDPHKPAVAWPEPALELRWDSPLEPICGSQRDCEAGNSTCRSDPNKREVKRCFCNDGLVWDAVYGVCTQYDKCQRSREGCDHSHDERPLIAGLTSAVVATVLSASVFLLVYRRHKRIKAAQEKLAREREEILNASGGKTAKIFSGKEVKKATTNFSRDNLLGTGGYGEVYEGTLEDGTVVAFKCAKVGNVKGIDQVLNEVRILCQVNHRNLVGLLGCCVELEQPIMVYEYIQNGTLYEHLHGVRSGGKGRDLTWIHRLQIARDTAEGLAYLHFSAAPPIYHRDVKSSNILLDNKLNAKVSDFGLSRLAHTDMSHISTCAQGTLGYLDPEYYRNYQLTDKSDVYSFGVVLLELLTSQKAIDFKREADDVNLAVYVQRLAEEERILDAVDPNLKEKASTMELDTMKALGFLALGCVEAKRQNRPSMKEVTEEIEYILSIATSKSEV